MFGHDIIPHHHVESDHNHHHHAMHAHSDAHANDSHARQHHSDSHDSSDENGGISDFLSFFVHTGDFTLLNTSIKKTIEIGNEKIVIPTIEFGYNISLNQITDSKSYGYKYKGPGYIPPYSNSKGLRAPPVFFS